MPVDGDKVTIAAAHVVTLDGTFVWGNDTTTGVVVSGGLKWSRTVPAQLTVKGTIEINNAAGVLDMGTAADPITAVTAVLKLNYSAAMAIGKYRLLLSTGKVFMQGVRRSRRTRIVGAAAAGALTFNVEDATGWTAGDQLFILPTSQRADNLGIEMRTISSVAGNTVELTSPLTYAKADGAFLGNLSSNLRVVEHDPAFGSNLLFNQGAVNNVVITDALLDMTGGGTTTAFNSMFGVAGGNGPEDQVVLTRMAVRTTNSNSDGAINLASYPRRASATDCLVLNLGSAPAMLSQGGFSIVGGIFASVLGSGFKSGETSAPKAGNTIRDAVIYVGGLVTPNNNMMSGTWIGVTLMWGRSDRTTGAGYSAPGIQYSNCDFAPFGMQSAPPFSPGLISLGDFTINTSVFPNAAFSPPYGTFPGGALYNFFGTYYGSTTQVVEGWKNEGYLQSIDTLVYRSLRSTSFTPRLTTDVLTRVVGATIPAGATRRLIGYVQRNAAYGAGNMPSVSINASFLANPITSAVADAADVWQKVDLTVTNTTASLQQLTVTLAARGAATATSRAYFSGIPDFPFVETSRHYGFQLDETSLFVTPDPAVTLSEAAAAAVVGVAVNHVAQTITVSAALTAQQVFCAAVLDLCQPANLGRAQHITSTGGADFTTTYSVLFTGAGAVAGSITAGNGKSAVLQLDGLSASAVLVVSNTGAVVDYQPSVTGTYTKALPLGSTGAWTWVVKRVGYEHARATFLPATGGAISTTPSTPQKLNADGTAMYTGTTSTLIDVSFAGGKAYIDIGNGSASLQPTFNETEQALVTQAGMEWIASGKDDCSLFESPSGEYLFLTAGWRVRRRAASDSNATLRAFVIGSDGMPIDESNGPVQFLTSDNPTAIASAVLSALVGNGLTMAQLLTQVASGVANTSAAVSAVADQVEEVASSVSAVPAAVVNHPVEGAFTVANILSIVGAVQAGQTTIESSAPGSARVEFQALSGGETRVAAEMTGSERTAVTLSLD